MIYAVFGVGIGNLGRGRAARRPMSEWVELLKRHLSDGTPPVHISGFFGHTGNFLADSPSTDLVKVAALSASRPTGRCAQSMTFRPP
jgi:hypothetical protein